MTARREPPPGGGVLGWPDGVAYATADLPGCAGRLGSAPEDFQVLEKPAYPPSGTGEHVFCRLWKRGLTTQQAIARVAQAVGVRPSDIGVAGQKDRHAVTEQVISVPGVPPERLRALSFPDLQIREAVPHGHKLRTGHLAGNRFRLRLVDTDDESAARALAILCQLSDRGVPNAYGPQRFGPKGASVADGLARLRGMGKGSSRFARRFQVSAVQAALFNAYLIARQARGGLGEPLAGEVLQRVGGGMFRCVDPGREAPRLEAREVVPTGPMFGPKMRPAAEGVAQQMEEAVLAAAGLERQHFAVLRRLAPGGRRPLVVFPKAVEVTPAEPDGLWLGFDLPAGSYATVVLREVLKRPYAELRAPGRSG